MTEEALPAPAAAKGGSKAKGKKEKAEKAEKSSGGIGGIIRLIVFILVGLIVLGVVGFAVYILALPDDLPKPFYVSFSTISPITGEAAGSEPEVVPTEEVATIPTDLMPGEGVMFDTGTKIINLADPGGRRYLKISIVLEFAPQEAEFYALEGEERTAAVTAFIEEMGMEKPILDDLLNTMLSSKMFDEIYTVEGKELLRQDIIQRTNALLPSEHLMYVYFTEFVVQ